MTETRPWLMVSELASSAVGHRYAWRHLPCGTVEIFGTIAYPGEDCRVCQLASLYNVAVVSVEKVIQMIGESATHAPSCISLFEPCETCNCHFDGVLDVLEKVQAAEEPTALDPTDREALEATIQELTEAHGDAEVRGEYLKHLIQENGRHSSSCKTNSTGCYEAFGISPGCDCWLSSVTDGPSEPAQVVAVDACLDGLVAAQKVISAEATRARPRLSTFTEKIRATKIAIPAFVIVDGVMIGWFKIPGTLWELMYQEGNRSLLPLVRKATPDTVILLADRVCDRLATELLRKARSLEAAIIVDQEAP